MTTYELALTLDKEQRARMAEAGILSASIERYICIYEMYLLFLARGLSKMEIYAAISEKCFTCEENVRKIIQKMQKEV